ncbi:MAG: hypothetical protein M3371_11305 [Acidobacteriota bacterium]|nr:hypothetical protein [Acidobacteriota bacterium]
MRHECCVALLVLLAAGVPQATVLAFDKGTEPEVARARLREPEDCGSIVSVSVKPPIILPSPLTPFSKDRTLASAYWDVYRILRADNSCSRFYGGSVAALTVFNSLAAQLKKSAIEDTDTGALMRGFTTTVMNSQTGLSYRLFEKATLNADGPFYQKRSHRTGRDIQRIGSQPPGTRQARALILLHEIGHLMPGPDGQWLLPNDGHDASRSQRNTTLVEAQCGAQLKALQHEPAWPAEFEQPALARRANK